MMHTQVLRVTTTYQVPRVAPGQVQSLHCGFTSQDSELLGKTPIAHDGANGFSCSSNHNTANRIAPSGMLASHITCIRS